MMLLKRWCRWLPVTALVIMLSPAVASADGLMQQGKIELVSLAETIRQGKPRAPVLHSSSALVIDESNGETLYEQNVDEQRPIASVTKVMTAMVVLDAKLPMDERIHITTKDRDRLRGSSSRLPFGTVLSRRDLLLTALAASDNRAAAALARTYPGGRAAILHAMNQKARHLGMTSTKFEDASGLHSGNVSTARDLAIMVSAANAYPMIKDMTTTGQFRVINRKNGKAISFINSNRLVRARSWNVRLSKTGYTSDAGNCLVMKTMIGERPVTMVFLNSWGKLSKYGDSKRIRDWVLRSERRALQLADAST